ncbi:MAG: AAA family ATPase [Lachnospiraceae bacterium]|nr:AAA family ATPase [Lachnospiraceae bacterium]
MKQILETILAELHRNTKRPFLIAIDGMCGSGKTTLGNFLAKELDASLFHMDDFFLQPHQRTEERLSEPGGNVDYERFREEVLEHISDTVGVTYRPFNCHEWKLADETTTVPYHDIVIIEGSYSHHPYFNNIYDVKIFLEISSEEQKKRIIARDGKDIWPMFEEKWIPMEKKYFEEFKIKEKSDYVQ